METDSNVEVRVEAKLHGWRRERVNRVTASIGVGFPGYEKFERKDRSEGANLVRSLNAIATGDYVSWDTLQRAKSAVQRQIEACAEQMQESYWSDHIVPADGAGATTPVGDGAVPLVLDPVNMMHVLMETRERQLTEAREALASLLVLEKNMAAAHAGLPAFEDGRVEW